jgi:hypothetical protein
MIGEQEMQRGNKQVSKCESTLVLCICLECTLWQHNFSSLHLFFIISYFTLNISIVTSMEANATTFPVHDKAIQSKLPGNMTVLNFESLSIDLGEARLRLDSSGKQIIMSVIALYIFIRNSWKMLQLLHSRPSNKIYWCCFIQAFGSVVVSVCGIILPLSSRLTCRAFVWTVVCGLIISTICTAICLLSKAYAVQMRDKRILWICIVCIPAPAIVIWGIAYEDNIFFTNDGACMISLPNWIPIVRGCVEIVINVIFSYIFLCTVVKQYQTFGSNCWSKLKSDGLLYLLCVTVSGIACAMIVVFQWLGPLSEMVFVVDCKYNVIYIC